MLEPSHMIIILVIALLVLGPKRLPGAGHALGQGLKEFRSSLSGGHNDVPPRSVATSADHEAGPSGGDTPS
jgi:sec-independent protein translocase protein TatA